MSDRVSVKNAAQADSPRSNGASAPGDFMVSVTRPYSVNCHSSRFEGASLFGEEVGVNCDDDQHWSLSREARMFLEGSTPLHPAPCATSRALLAATVSKRALIKCRARTVSLEAFVVRRLWEPAPCGGAARSGGGPLELLLNDLQSAT